jgi:predicted amidohydrolase
MTLKVAAVQFFATPFAPERNLQTAERLVREAAGNGAQIVGLPELFNIGYVYTPRLRSVAEAEDGPTTQWLKRLSDELQVAVGGVILQTSEVAQTAKTSAVFVLVEPSDKIHRHRKQHLFLWEHCFIEGSRDGRVVETRFGRLGLVIGWEAAYQSTWEALRGKVDLVLVSSAVPRWHRAVLNFPEAKKVYTADLVPDVLAARAEIDDWFLGGLGRAAAFVGCPVMSSGMSGRFVSALPLARLSFGLMSVGRAKYAGWAHAAGRATVRATFYGNSTVFGSGGKVEASVTGEAGWAMAEISGTIPKGDGKAVAPDSHEVAADKYWFAKVPKHLDRLEKLIKLFSK